MNQELYDYIEELLNIGVNNFEELSEMDKLKIVGYIVADSEEPFNFIVESEHRNKLLHLFIKYCLSKTVADMKWFSSESWVVLTENAIDYHKDKIEQLFNEVKESVIGPYPEGHDLEEYGCRRGE